MPRAQDLGNGVARQRAEHGERGGLGGDHDVVEIVATGLVGAPAGHQSQLVDRQRPRGTRGHDERDALWLAISGLGHQLVDAERLARDPERGRRAVRGDLASADADDNASYSSRAPSASSTACSSGATATTVC